MSYTRIKCPHCKLDFGQEKVFTSHLMGVHGIEDPFSLYLTLYHNGIHPKCECSPNCDSPLKWNGWKRGFQSRYARGHNARLDSSFKNQEFQRHSAQLRSEGYQEGKYSVWNKGLDKESSQKILDMSSKISSSLREGYLTGKIIDWRVRDEDKAKMAVEKMSNTKKLLNKKPWNFGKSSTTDSKIKEISEKISLSYLKRESGKRLKIKQLISRVDNHNDKFVLLSDPNEYKTRRVGRLLFQCKICGAQQSKSLAMLEETPICFSCHPKESLGQLEIFEFVKSLCSDAVISDRNVISPKELDIWVPSQRFAIEYNGLYWHSSHRQIDPLYHVKKLDSCAKSEIRLLSIYEDEWKDRGEIVRSMIRHRLGVSQRVFNARNLTIVDVLPGDAKIFFENNHLEGHVVGVKYLGLRNIDGELLACVSLRRPFHLKYAGNLELGRCATSLNTHVRGWLGKLSKAAIKYCKESGHSSMMTYVDQRVGDGSGYASAGWKLVNSGGRPRFWWTDSRARYNRFLYKADSSRGLSQDEVAEEAGMKQIYGCRNSLYFYGA
jgi:hypothetical protein